MAQRRRSDEGVYCPQLASSAAECHLELCRLEGIVFIQRE
jgi:hypothetical protein